MKSKYLIIIISCFVLSSGCFRGERKKEQLGVYQIDLTKTKLGVYNKDSLLYKDLKIVFKDDYTFKLNMAVPFIYGEEGSWEIGNDSFYEWNKLCYSNAEFCDQFYQCCDSDSTFNLQSVSPRPGNDRIQIIWFKKIGGVSN